MAYSPDSQWLAFAGPQDLVQLTRIDSAKTTYELNAGSKDVTLTRLTFSPDGRQLACAGIHQANAKNANRIFIYEMASRRIRLELAGHHGRNIECLAYSHDSGLLASGATDTTALVWNAGLHGFAKAEGSAKEATADELAKWFQQMAGSDAKAAFGSMIRLVQTPKQAVTLLEDKIAPAKKFSPGEKIVRQWIEDLGNGQFAVRSKANEMLQKIGSSVEPDLRAALPRAKNVEMKRRIEEILERIASPEWTPEEVLHARAVEVVEAIALPEARALLSRWTTGDPAAVLTAEARKALARLGRAEPV